MASDGLWRCELDLGARRVGCGSFCINVSAAPSAEAERERVLTLLRKFWLAGCHLRVTSTTRPEAVRRRLSAAEAGGQMSAQNLRASGSSDEP